MPLPVPANLLFQANLTTDPDNPLLLGTAESKLYLVNRSFQSTPRQYQVLLSDPIFTGAAGTSGYNWSAADFYNKVLFAQHNNVPQYWIGNTTVTFDLPGLNRNVDPYSDVSDTSEIYDGVTVFFGHALLWKGAIIKGSDLNDFTNYIPVGETVTSATLTVAVAFTQPAVGSTVVVTTTEDPTAEGTLLTVGQFVRLDDAGAGVPYYNFYSVTAISAGPNHVTLKLLGTTGHTPVGATVPINRLIQTLDANEAFEEPNGGALINGPIWQIVPMGDYAYVFKEWSIQSMQYTGIGNGIYYFHTEVVREGLLGRNCVKNLGNGNCIFLGHRELYNYTGGAQPNPVCRQFTRQLFSELDRTRLNQIVIFHRESRNEAWVVYPIVGGQKVLIWNYVEDTATLDVYGAALMGLTAAQEVDWSSDPTWIIEPDALLWGGFAPTTIWSDLVSTGSQQVALLATGGGDLLVQGEVWTRDGTGYTALAETMDYDFGDRAAFKYIDVVNVGLQVSAPDNQIRNLYVQVGYRTTLDADITWTTPKAISVQGNANFTAKVNPGGSGRFIRLRFYSSDVNVQWRISSFEIYGRMGGTY